MAIIKQNLESRKNDIDNDLYLMEYDQKDNKRAIAKAARYDDKTKLRELAEECNRLRKKRTIKLRYRTKVDAMLTHVESTGDDYTLFASVMDLNSVVASIPELSSTEQITSAAYQFTAAKDRAKTMHEAMEDVFRVSGSDEEAENAEDEQQIKAIMEAALEQAAVEVQAKLEHTNVPQKVLIVAPVEVIQNEVRVPLNISTEAQQQPVQEVKIDENFDKEMLDRMRRL